MRGGVAAGVVSIGDAASGVCEAAAVSDGRDCMIITPEQACKSILEMLHKSVENIPEERRDAVLEKVLNAFSGQMFQGPAEKPE